MEIKIGDIGKGLEKPHPISIQMPDAEKYLRRGLALAIGDNYQWLPEYSGYFDDKKVYHRGIIDWLADNQCKGLLMYGHCGRGKSIIGEKIIPRLILWWYNHLYGKNLVFNCFSYRDLNDKLEEIKKCKFVYIDDIGQEELGKSFGNTIHAFADIVDNADKKGNLLILSTNLDIDELGAKYGDRVMSRLRGMTLTVKFSGKDLRYEK